MFTLVGIFSVVYGIIEAIGAYPDAGCSEYPLRSEIFDCCNHHILLNNYGVICAEKLPSQIQPTNSSQFPLCLSECIFKEAGIISNAPEFDLEKVKASFGRIYYDSPEFIAILENALKECIIKVNKKMAEAIQIHLGDDFCDPEVALTAQCILLHSLSRCPTERWGLSPLCQHTRKFFKLCNNYFSY